MTGQIEKLVLPERGQTVKVGDNVTVVGWGLQCSNAECTEQKTSDSVLRVRFIKLLMNDKGAENN